MQAHGAPVFRNADVREKWEHHGMVYMQRRDGTTGTHMHIENTGQADLEFLHSAPAADSVATDPLFPSSVVYMYKPRRPSSLGYSKAA